MIRSNVDSLFDFDLEERSIPHTTPNSNHIYRKTYSGDKRNNSLTVSAIRGSIRSKVKQKGKYRNRTSMRGPTVGPKTPHRLKKRFGTEWSLKSGSHRRLALKVLFGGYPELIGVVLLTRPDVHRMFITRHTLRTVSSPLYK